MKYADTPKQTSEGEKICAEDCIPGEIYELVVTGTYRKDKPRMEDLRVCTAKHDMISLLDGARKSGTVKMYSGAYKIYVPRPDIQLTIVVD